MELRNGEVSLHDDYCSSSFNDEKHLIKWAKGLSGWAKALFIDLNPVLHAVFSSKNIINVFTYGNSSSYPLIVLTIILKLLTFHSEEENDSHALPCLQLHYKHSDNRGPQVRRDMENTMFLHNSLCLDLFIFARRYLVQLRVLNI